MHIAHINQKSKKEQTVAEHCQNAGDFGSEFGAKIDFAETAMLAGNLHDLGKDTNKFEDYLRYSVAHSGDYSQRGKINHSSAGAKFIYENHYKEDIYQRITAQLLALVICGHHGGLPDIISLDGFNNFAKKINPEKDICFEECLKNFTNNYKTVTQLGESFKKSRNEVENIINRMKEMKICDTFSLHLLVKFLFSCLIDADRLDTYNFMENKGFSESNINSGDLWNELSNRLEESISKFNKENNLDVLRGEISETCKKFAINKPGVYRLCVPTGGGKTLSSLRYALEHAKIKGFNKERIFYVIPFTTIIDQNAKVIKDILRRDDIILEHHSNLINDNEKEDYKLLTERWNSPIVLTTMVQFLNTLFSGGTQDIRRLHNLANSIIIFDEIQSVPIKCVHMLNGALNFLSKVCNATIILCTATQPLLSETDKPLHISTPPDIIENLDEKFKQFKRVNLINSQIDGGYDTNMLADFTLEKMKTIRNTLVILNTKKSVRELFNCLNQLNSVVPDSEKINIFHLSTNMCPNHRIIILDDLKKKLLDGERTICISTQLIEAGIDISFECVIRATTGFDSITQAAGRCNRHAEKLIRNTYIVNIKNENLSNLIEIREGKDCTEQILYEFETNPKIFDYDLLSPKIMDRYYELYFYKKREEMNFSVKKENIKLYDLLSLNTKGLQAFMGRPENVTGYPINQAFKTAGRYFCPIDNNTTGVIVPYGEGKSLITKINGDIGSLDKLKEYLQKAQQYSVNLYDNDIRKIGNGIFQLKNGGVLALANEYYDNNLGVMPEGKAMDTLIE